MTDDQDNAGEVVAGAVRAALTAAGQLAEHAARRREADLRDAERVSAARVATLQSQLAADRELALRSVRDVVERGNTATVEEVIGAWEQSRGWQDPAMAAGRTELEERIRERFGVDASTVAADRSTIDSVTAAAVVGHDVEVQAADKREREAGQGRESGLAAELVEADVTSEAAAARALAAESHPTQVTEAARPPQVTPAGRTRGRRRSKNLEVQGPGR